MPEGIVLITCTWFWSTVAIGPNASAFAMRCAEIADSPHATPISSNAWLFNSVPIATPMATRKRSSSPRHSRQMDDERLSPDPRTLPHLSDGTSSRGISGWKLNAAPRHVRAWRGRVGWGCETPPVHFYCRSIPVDLRDVRRVVGAELLASRRMGYIGVA